MLYRFYYFIHIQGVHKVSLQFQKFITKANEKKDKWKLLQTETNIFKFSFVSFNTRLDTLRATNGARVEVY